MKKLMTVLAVVIVASLFFAGVSSAEAKGGNPCPDGAKDNHFCSETPSGQWAHPHCNALPAHKKQGRNLKHTGNCAPPATETVVPTNTPSATPSATPSVTPTVTETPTTEPTVEPTPEDECPNLEDHNKVPEGWHLVNGTCVPITTDDEDPNPTPPPAVPGCTIENASNYNKDATFDDGSCEFDDGSQVKVGTEPQAMTCFGQRHEAFMTENILNEGDIIIDGVNITESLLFGDDRRPDLRCNEVAWVRNNVLTVASTDGSNVRQPRNDGFLIGATDVAWGHDRSLYVVYQGEVFKTDTVGSVLESLGVTNVKWIDMDPTGNWLGMVMEDGTVQFLSIAGIAQGLYQPDETISTFGEINFDPNGSGIIFNGGSAHKVGFETNEEIVLDEDVKDYELNPAVQEDSNLLVVEAQVFNENQGERSMLSNPETVSFAGIKIVLESSSHPDIYDPHAVAPSNDIVDWLLHHATRVKKES